MLNKLLHLPRYLVFSEWHPFVRVQSIKFRRAARGVVCEILYSARTNRQFSWKHFNTKLKSHSTIIGALVKAYRQMLLEAREYLFSSTEYSREEMKYMQFSQHYSPDPPPPPDRKITPETVKGNFPRRHRDG